jgi:hypothetical protein
MLATFILPAIVFLVSEGLLKGISWVDNLGRYQWTRSVAGRGCRVLNYSGGWMTLMCGQESRVVALAGISIPARHDTLSDIDRFLNRLLYKAPGTEPAPQVFCDLVLVSATNRIPDVQTFGFADCTIGGVNISEYLVASGVVLPAPLKSAAMQAASGVEQRRLAILHAVENSPPALLAVATWVATLFGVIGAATGFFLSRSTAATKERLRRDKVAVAKDAFNRAWFRLSGGNTEPGEWDRAGQSLEAYAGALDSLEGLLGKALPAEVKQAIERVRVSLKSHLLDTEGRLGLDESVGRYLHGEEQEG